VIISDVKKCQDSATEAERKMKALEDAPVTIARRAKALKKKIGNLIEQRKLLQDANIHGDSLDKAIEEIDSRQRELEVPSYLWLESETEIRHKARADSSDALDRALKIVVDLNQPITRLRDQFELWHGQYGTLKDVVQQMQNALLSVEEQQGRVPASISIEDSIQAKLKSVHLEAEQIQNAYQMPNINDLEDLTGSSQLACKVATELTDIFMRIEKDFTTLQSAIQTNHTSLDTITRSMRAFEQSPQCRVKWLPSTLDEEQAAYELGADIGPIEKSRTTEALEDNLELSRQLKALIEKLSIRVESVRAHRQEVIDLIDQITEKTVPNSLASAVTLLSRVRQYGQGSGQLKGKLKILQDRAKSLNKVVEDIVETRRKLLEEYYGKPLAEDQFPQAISRMKFFIENTGKLHRRITPVEKSLEELEQQEKKRRQELQKWFTTQQGELQRIEDAIAKASKEETHPICWSQATIDKLCQQWKKAETIGTTDVQMILPDLQAPLRQAAELSSEVEGLAKHVGRIRFIRETFIKLRAQLRLNAGETWLADVRTRQQQVNRFAAKHWPVPDRVSEMLATAESLAESQESLVPIDPGQPVLEETIERQLRELQQLVNQRRDFQARFERIGEKLRQLQDKETDELKQLREAITTNVSLVQNIERVMAHINERINPIVWEKKTLEALADVQRQVEELGEVNLDRKPDQLPGDIKTAARIHQTLRQFLDAVEEAKTDCIELVNLRASLQRDTGHNVQIQVQELLADCKPFASGNWLDHDDIDHISAHTTKIVERRTDFLSKNVDQAIQEWTLATAIQSAKDLQRDYDHLRVRMQRIKDRLGELRQMRDRDLKRCREAIIHIAGLKLVSKRLLQNIVLQCDYKQISDLHGRGEVLHGKLNRDENVFMPDLTNKIDIWIEDCRKSLKRTLYNTESQLNKQAGKLYKELEVINKLLSGYGQIPVISKLKDSIDDSLMRGTENIDNSVKVGVDKIIKLVECQENLSKKENDITKISQNANLLKSERKEIRKLFINLEKELEILKYSITGYEIDNIKQEDKNLEESLKIMLQKERSLRSISSLLRQFIQYYQNLKGNINKKVEDLQYINVLVKRINTWICSLENCKTRYLSDTERTRAINERLSKINSGLAEYQDLLREGRLIYSESKIRLEELWDNGYTDIVIVKQGGVTQTITVHDIAAEGPVMISTVVNPRS